MRSEGHELLEQGRFEAALSWFEQSDDAQARFGRGVALQQLGHFDEAEVAYESVLAIFANHAETLANLVALNIERFELARVERYATRLLEAERDSKIALRGLIVVAVERRDYRAAAAYFARLGPEQAPCGDAVEYRLSWQMLERIKEHYGAPADPH